MEAGKITVFLAIMLLVSQSVAFSMAERREANPPPLSSLRLGPTNEPYVLSSGGDTTWVQVHTDSTYCPGDPGMGHGGEATGGPGPLETWCFEGGFGDSCGANPPWDTNCFTHADVRAQPSEMGINYWHIDTYRTDQRDYCGDYALWCGSDSLWIDGNPVECGTWVAPPGYGDQWNCIVQLTLPDTFNVANGCTLLFDPRYDTECNYDYFYVDFWNGSKWVTLAAFNSSSNTGGGTCGPFGQPTADYFGNSDAGQPNTADWQQRFDPDLPAFYRVITEDTLLITSGPRFRWRFVSDASWSDADGRGDTDGAAWIDNVWVWGDSERFADDFESGALAPWWSLPDPDPVRDDWRVRYDVDPPYEGGDGGDRVTCSVDSSWQWSARPPGGYSGPNKNRWYYRLISPRIPIQNSGCVVQYDEYVCVLDYTCDYLDVRARFYDNNYGQWCPWVDPSPLDLFPFSCGLHLNRNTDISDLYGATADSVQYAWHVIDLAQPGDFCYGKHNETQYMVDNVSVGFFDATASRIRARGIDLLHDTFFTGLCGYNSFFDTYDPDTVSCYWGGQELPWKKQLVVTVADRDDIAAVELFASIDEGATWVSGSMVLRSGDPLAYGGDYSGTVCPADFGDTAWTVGTEVWYYVKATDLLSNESYFPTSADPQSQYHTGDGRSYLTFSVFPLYPEGYTGPRILLVDGDRHRHYDWSPCLSEVDSQVQLGKLYGRVLTEAGYCYDRYDIGGPGYDVHTNPIWFGDYYDAVVWFTGPDLSSRLFDKEAQVAIRDYLGNGGKVVLCGDGIAFNMAPYQEGGGGADSLGGDFLGGIMGVTYLGDMPDAFSYPYVYAVGVETLEVFGSPVEVGLDTMLIYRECPELKYQMSYVVANDSPPAGYTSQVLMYISNPTVPEADEVIYTEYQGVGQCVFVNFDLSASVNHIGSYCSGDAQRPAPDFDPGTYEGRVELMRTILEDVFGLPSTGAGGLADVLQPRVHHSWALGQNVPNPCVSSTEIRFEIARRSYVRLKVYNALGQVVRVLVEESKEPGRYNVRWDARNASGERVGSGVYFYKIEAGDFTATRKMLVIK